MTKISGQLLISGQFQDNYEISGNSGISGQLGALQTWSGSDNPSQRYGRLKFSKLRGRSVVGGWLPVGRSSIYTSSYT